MTTYSAVSSAKNASKTNGASQARAVVPKKAMKFRAQRYSQQRTQFFNCVVTADQVSHLAVVPRYDPRTKQGYQRDPDERHAKHAADHLLKGGTFPGAMILSIREGDLSKITVEVVQSFDHYDEVTVTIPERTPLWLVDGQHRVRAVEIAQQDPDAGFEAEKFGMPAVIMVSPSEIDEALTFKTVHETQKNMATDLTNRILQREVEEGRTNPQELIATGQKKKYRDYVAVRVTEALATHNDSPWCGLVRPTNPGQLPSPEEGGEERLWNVTEVGLEASVKEFTRHMGIAPAEKTLGIVKTYWRAVVKVCADAWENPDDYPFLRKKTAGMNILHMILPTIYDIARENGGEATEEAFVELLEEAGVDNALFVKNGRLKGIGGLGGYKTVAQEFEARLMKLYGHSL